MGYGLRVATPSDVDAIMELETATFESDAWSTESMSCELASPHTYYLFAFDPETPSVLAGYGGLLVPSGSGDADIQTIAVAPAARRNGLGRTLVTAMLAEAAARGAGQVFLEVRADNPNARALYESLGFEQIAVRAKYYQPDGVDAQIMRVTL
ncbi:MAG: [ribosomal protein S18]-alanine N-acetyltransferase [Actinomycetota bacterium]|jgi:ribosomal-protein-alanine acetyltransferase|nr:[ribosomal protein S18]-alanine N-acetyltransferase [Actinomycetota bacterium]